MRGCYATAAGRGRERERESEVRRSDAVRVGAAWLQRHGCCFVNGRNKQFEAAARRRRRGRKGAIYFDAWPRPSEGEIYTGTSMLHAR